MTIEYLTTDSPTRRRRSPWVSGVALLLVVAVVTAFMVWADHLKSEANRQLSQAVVAAQDRARIGEGRVNSTLVYASPMIWSTEVPADVQAGLRALVEESAADMAATLTDLVDEVEGIRILPWQSAQAEARERVLEFILAERSRFDRISADAREIRAVLAESRPSIDAAMAALGQSGAEQ